MVDEGKRHYAHTQAARMLSEALKRHTARHAGGLRALAAKLDMKQAVNLSHMANGRMPIPFERAPELAAFLGLDVTAFSLAVLEQRAPNIYATLDRDLRLGALAALSSEARRACDVIAEAPHVSDEQVKIIVDVLADRHPAERWLKPAEVPMISLIREHRPNGLTLSELAALRIAIEVALEVGQ